MTAAAKQDFWRSHIELAPSSGLTVKAYCEQSGLSTASFYQWRRRLSDSGFDEIEVVEEGAPPLTIDLSQLDHTVLCRMVQVLAGQSHA